MALVHVLATVATHARVGGHRRTAPWALQSLRGRLVVLVEVGELDHQVGRHDGQGKVDLHLGLAGGQLHLFGFVPASGSEGRGTGSVKIPRIQDGECLTRQR